MFPSSGFRSLRKLGKKSTPSPGHAEALGRISLRLEMAGDACPQGSITLSCDWHISELQARNPWWLHCGLLSHLLTNFSFHMKSGAGPQVGSGLVIRTALPRSLEQIPRVWWSGGTGNRTDIHTTKELWIIYRTN